MSELVIPLIFFAVAFCYSSIGFGGGSSYLALLSIFLLDFHEIRSVALVLNLAVVSIGTYSYIKNKVFSKSLFWPFIVFSMPMAFIGAQLRLTQQVFFLVLGSSLLLSAVFMGLQVLQRSATNKHFSWHKRGILGSGIGFLSGVAGIGGGIFLSPTLNLLGWANARTVAALASVFILCNSIAGIGGLLIADSFQINLSFLLPLLAAVIVGGSLGAYISNHRLNVHLIRGLTALMVAYVGLSLVLLHGFNLHI